MAAKVRGNIARIRRDVINRWENNDEEGKVKKESRTVGRRSKEE